MQNDIHDLTTSLEFTQREVVDLKQEVKQHKEEKKSHLHAINILQEEFCKSKNNIEELECRANYQEDYNRRKNLRIVGIEERPGGETWDQTAVEASKLLINKLQLPNIELERTHRVGQRNDHQHRPIVARFKWYGDKEAFMRSVAKLRGTRIFINKNLCPASQATRGAQLPALKQAVSEGKVAYFRHTKLIIMERPNKKRTSVGISTRGASGLPIGASGGSTSSGVVSCDSVAVVSDRGTPPAASGVTTSNIAASASAAFPVASDGGDTHDAVGPTDGEGVGVSTTNNRPAERTTAQKKSQSSRGGR